LTTTLASGYTSFMWADAIHFSTVGHGLMGATAYNKAYNQF
jgi:hypothetical protein